MLPKNLGNSISLSFVRRLLFALSFMAFIFVGAGPLNLEALIKGDINNDGRVDIQDAIRSLRMHIGTEPVDLPKGDLNYDSLVNPTDADLILKMGLGLVTLPPDPGSVALPPDPTVATNLSAATQFLYTGTNPVQTGVSAGTIDAKRVAVIRGKVMTREGLPLSAVAITILNHPEYGRTLTRDDGMFDLVVNGGGALTVDYQKEGYLPAQRQGKVPWQDYVWMPDVVLITLDAQVTAVNLSAPSMQVARGSVQLDSDGSRRATLLFPQGTSAELVMPDGSTRTVTTLNVRATEYSVGPNGPQAMPAELPPTSCYTYCVELSADEALAMGAADIGFSQPLYLYVENFLNFPTGIPVPVGYYDRAKGVWVASDNGRVIKILSVSGGLAELDTDGDGAVDNGVTLGVTDAERQQLAVLYSAGQSLSRAPISHFSPEDLNYAVVPPADSRSPQMGRPRGRRTQDWNNTQGGHGTIELQNQVLGETANIIGTSFQLHYTSDRMPGNKGAQTVEIPLSGPDIPASLQKIQLELEIAGRKVTQTFSPAANQTYLFEWDGMDAYGRRLEGKQTLKTRIGYTYKNSFYALPPSMSFMERWFGAVSGQIIQGDISARAEFTIWEEQTVSLSFWRSPNLGLGGWSLSEHHVYDPVGQVLYLGDGSRRSIENMNSVVRTVGGSGTIVDCSTKSNYGGDGGLATHATMCPAAGAIGPDGSIYFPDITAYRIRKIAPNGIVTTIAGTGVSGFSGDGGQATEAQIKMVVNVAVGPDGSVYLSDPYNGRIRKVNPQGIITTVASVGCHGIAVGPDGSVYCADFGVHKVHQVWPDGRVVTIAGTGEQCPLVNNACGDGGPSTSARLGSPMGLAVGPDGSLYIADSYGYRIRRVGPDGIIRAVAGRIATSSSYYLAPEDGDGGPATEAKLDNPHAVAVGRDGSVYIAGFGAIRRVGPDGIITKYAGQEDRNMGYSGDGGPATQAKFRSIDGVAMGPDGSLYLFDFSNNRIRRVGSILPSFDASDIAIAAEDGTVVYRFDQRGRHLSTVNALTGAVVLQFEYDGGGLLNRITDAHGNATTIGRSGNTITITGPYGQQTLLGLNGSGYLEAVTNPASETTHYGYDSGGLLTAVVSPQLKSYSFSYDSSGRLILAQDPGGGSLTLTRSDTGSDYEVVSTSGLLRTSKFRIESLSTGGTHRVNTYADGTKTDITLKTDGSNQTTLPEGTASSLVQGPDPRFGMQSPIMKSLTVTTPAGLNLVSTTESSATLADQDDLFSVTQMTETSFKNGQTFISAYNAAARTVTQTTPEGRRSFTVTDDVGKILQHQVEGREADRYTYDLRGRIVELSRGSGPGERVTHFSYSPEGRLSEVTTPLGRKQTYEYDAIGRLTRQTRSDGHQVSYTYDTHGNLTSITPSGRPAHLLTYTPVDLVSSYTPAGGLPITWTFNSDRQLTKVARPDGTSLDLIYDSSGRREKFGNSVAGFITNSFDPSTGRLAAMTALDGGTITYSYDGSFPTQTSWFGTVSGSITRSYNNDMTLSAMSINGGPPVDYVYDHDGLATQVGQIHLSHDPQNGFLTGTTLGGITESITYSLFGEIQSETVAFNSVNIYSVLYTRDKLGRITERTETISGGAPETFEYLYDTGDRLTQVKKNGTTTANYTYDSHDNRLSYTGLSGVPMNGVYNNRDQLLSYGGTTYTYNHNGELFFQVHRRTDYDLSI